MNFLFTRHSAMCTAALAAALLQVACADGMAASASPGTPAATETFAGGDYLPSQYPAPQGEIQALPAQF